MKTALGGEPRVAPSIVRALAIVIATFVLVIAPAGAEPPSGGSLDPTTIPKYAEPLVIPPAMPRTKVVDAKGKQVDYYEIVVKQFQQYILPQAWSAAHGADPTTVWSYGSMVDPRPVSEGGTLNYPALTIEALKDRPVRVKWINGLVDENGQYLPHLFAVDQTLHWANPAGGPGGTDTHGMDATPYTGPVPIVTHVHGAHTTEDSDGFPEAWTLPAADNIPAGYATSGTLLRAVQAGVPGALGSDVGAGDDDVPVPQRPASDDPVVPRPLARHDAAQRVRGPGRLLPAPGPKDRVAAKLPRPAPQRGDKPGTRYHEIPIAIQDRSFNADGSLFYPDNRAFFEGLNQPGQPQQFPGAPELQLPFIPDMALDGQMSDISPQWNPEFFGNTMVVNGKTWPYLNVEQRRYRLRLLNGSESRFLILRMSNGMRFTQIGSEGGYLPEPVRLKQLLIAPAERADVIVDFSKVKRGTRIVLQNVGPDEPFGGGAMFKDFEPSDPATTGQVMQFRVKRAKSADTSVPAPGSQPAGDRQIRQVEQRPQREPQRDGFGQRQVRHRRRRQRRPRPARAAVRAAGGRARHVDRAGWPAAAQVDGRGDRESGSGRRGDLEHPQLHHGRAPDPRPPGAVPGREARGDGPEGCLRTARWVEGAVIKPEAWEMGFKDTVIVYPGEYTQIKARFDTAGLFVWHCHILEHEDNEMMRPYRVGPAPPAAVTTTPQ